MKHSFITRFSAASLFILALGIFASSASYGAVNAYLIFKSSDGKTFKATPDAGGKFSFTNVQPGTYSLILAGSDEYFAAKSADKDKHKNWIELQSFSWGTSSGTIISKSTDKSTPGIAVADVNKDGRNDFAVQNIISSPRKISLDNPVKDGSAYYVIVMSNVIVTSACSASGTVSNIAIKENGVK
jgi:hypothetical protein